MDQSSSATPIKSTGIPKFSSRLPASRLPAPGKEARSALPSPSKPLAPAQTSPVKRALPKPASAGPSRSSIAGPPSGIPPKTALHRPTYSVSGTKKPASRPLSYIGQSRRPISTSVSAHQKEDLNDQLGSLNGFRSASRTASRQGTRDDSPPSNHDHDRIPTTPKSKASSRLSLSDRTVESITRLPPTPGTDRRRSSFFAPQSPMGPPSRPTSAMSNGSRPGTSESSYVRPASRVASPVKRSIIGMKAPSRVSVDYSTPRSLSRTSNVGLPRLGRPASVIGKPASIGTPKAAAPRPLQRANSLRQPGVDMGAVSSTPNSRPATATTTSVVKPRPTPVTAVRGKPPVEARPLAAKPPAKPAAVPTAVGTSAATAVTSSSAALREQIAKAKAAKRTAPIAQSAGSNEGGGTFEFDPFGDPFNSKPKDNKGLLRKKIDAARADGRLNIAAMGLRDIPDEILHMYDAEQMADSNITWNQTMDVVRFVAADNELETIRDDLFPDIDNESAANDDDSNPQALQFRSVETIDFHGNSLQAIPAGLRWLEGLTTLNLSHNKLSNAIFDTISQIESLRELKLGNNNISGYLPPSISRLRNLKTLELQSNKLLSLPDGFRDLVELQALNVAGNQLSGLPMDVLEGLPLVDLNVSNNAMVGALFPFGVSGLPKLEYLDVANNSLASLAFSENLSLPALKSLNIASNRIVGLPDVSGWSGLVALAAAENKMAAIPQGFTTLKNLRQADFSGNELTKLHDNVALMTSLEVLKVAANPLRERKYLNMPTDELKRSLLQKLKNSGQAEEFEDEGIDIQSPQESTPQWSVVAGTLDLRDRGLVDDDADVLRTIFGEHDVRELKLARNSFATIPFEISMAQNLKILDLSSCALGDDYLTEVVTLQSLQELFLSGNKMSSWEPLLDFLNAPRLSYLDVSNNRFVGSLPSLKGSFPEMGVLHAANNKIDAISADGLRGLHSVDLANNNIGFVPPQIGLLWFEGLKGISLAGNVFRVPSHRVLEKGTESTMEWLREKIPEDEETF